MERGNARAIRDVVKYGLEGWGSGNTLDRSHFALQTRRTRKKGELPRSDELSTWRRDEY